MTYLRIVDVDLSEGDMSYVEEFEADDDASAVTMSEAWIVEELARIGPDYSWARPLSVQVVRPAMRVVLSVPKWEPPKRGGGK